MAAGGRHRAIVEVAGRVEGAEKELKKLRTEMGRLEKKVAQSNKQFEEQKGLVEFGANATIAFEGMQQLAQGVKAYGQEARRIEGVYRNQKFGLDAARASTQGMVSDLDLLKLGNSAAALGIAQNTKGFAEYARAADLAGRKLGLGPVEAMESLNAALGRGSSEMLDNLGIVLKKADAERQYSAQLGKLRSQLTEAEKAEAFRVIGMQKVIESSKDANAEMSEGSKMAAQFATAMENLENNTKNLPYLFGELVTEVDHLAQSWFGFRDEVEGSATAWDTFKDGALGSLAAVGEAVTLVQVGIDRLQVALAGTSGTAAMMRGAAGVALTKARMDASNTKAGANALGVVQGLGAAGMDALSIVHGAGQTFANSIKDPEQAKRGRGGRGGSRGTIAGQQGSTGALDIGTLSLDARNEGRVGMLAREQRELERVMELESVRAERAMSIATSDEERHMLIMMGLEDQAKIEEQIFAKRIEAAQVNGDMAEVRELEHEREVYRLGVQYEKESELERARQAHLEAERRRTQERIALAQQWMSAGTSTLNEYGQTYQAFAAAAGVSEEARRKAGLRVQGALTIGEAALSFTRALSATAVGNVPGAIAGFAGAAFGFSRGALMLAGGIPSPKGGGGGGGGQGGVMGTTFAGGGGPMSKTDAPNSRVPGSPTSADSRPRPTGSSSGSRGGDSIVVNYSPGIQVGSADQEAAEKLAGFIRQAKGAHNA